MKKLKVGKLFNKKQEKNPLKGLGMFCLVEVTDFGHKLGVNTLKISTFYDGQRIKEESFSQELLDEKVRKDIPVVWAETYPEEYERMPTTKLILGRLELPRLGLFEEL